MSIKIKRPKSDLDLAIEALTELQQHEVENVGGYPGGIYNYPPGWVIVVDNEGNEPKLQFFREQTVVNWYREAKGFLRDNPEDGMTIAMYETWPDEDSRTRMNERHARIMDVF